jgi:glycine cleavage system H protein
MMNFPENLKYTQEHEWFLLNGNVATIGITAFAQNELGDIVYVDINSVGQTLAKDAIFGSVEAVKTVSDLFLPVGGKILEVNNLIDAKPELVNTDPYGDGWMVKIEVTNLAETEKLLSASEYKALVGM